MPCNRRRAEWILAVALLGVLAGCSKSPQGLLVQNQRPQIELSSGPLQNTEEFYSIRFTWFAFDPDGRVTHFIYTVDPPVAGDTTWTTVRASEITLFYPSKQPQSPLPPLTFPTVTSRDYHTFVVKAVDNEGATSPPVSRSFTSKTIAPSTSITRPIPSRLQPSITTPSITIDWQGTDPDGVISQKPVKYKFRLVPANVINPGNPDGILAADVQNYFGQDAVNFFATWDSVPGDTAFKFYEGLTPQTLYYFAVVAFDEAGAYEPRFNMDTNVLQFRPTLNKLGPKITVFNEFFSRTQTTGGVSLAPSRIVPIEFPANSRVRFNWTATPPTGAVITGYRWTLDIEGQDIGNETPRVDDGDLAHWSSWSLSETSALVGPFAGSRDTTATHFFYLEARDNLGFVSLYTIRIEVVAYDTLTARPLLVIDDMYGTTDNLQGIPIGSYPTEAEQDTFYYAVGGFGIPRDKPPTSISVPGMFAGFDYDTLDYRFYPNEGILLSDLSKYRVVAWYTDNSGTSRTGDKFSSTPSTAIRYVNAVNHLNTYAVFLRQGGKGWIFGDGTTAAIANGYWTRIGSGAPTLPYSTGDNPRQNILREGNFLWDFCHLRSELNTAGTAQTQFTQAQQLRGCIPYLPQFAGPATPTDRSHDPRIGPSAERNVAAWGNLPQLTLSTFRGANPDINQRSVNLTWIITKPLFDTEGSGTTFHSVADTLYLCQARQYDPTNVSVPSDGKPNALFYHGSEHGEFLWMGFPLYFFEPDQARLATSVILTNMGIHALPPALHPGAHPMLRKDNRPHYILETP